MAYPSHAWIIVAFIAGMAIAGLALTMIRYPRSRAQASYRESPYNGSDVRQQPQQAGKGLGLLQIEIGERKLAEQEALRLSRILDDSANEIYILDSGTLKITQVNRGSIRNLGYDMDELRGMTLLELLSAYPEEILDKNVEILRDGLTDVVIFEAQFVRKDGSEYPVEIRLQYYESPDACCFIAMVTDIHERYEAQEQMSQLSRAVESTGDAVMITDRNGIIEYVNPAFEKLTGYSKSEIIGASPRKMKSGRHEEAFYAALWETINSGREFRNVFINCKKGGTLYYEEKTIAPIRNTMGEITHFVATGKDISQSIKTQERLDYLAHHDQLTGLPNRIVLTERLEHALSHARRKLKYSNACRSLAVLFIDLDRFKAVNDSLGHHIGDKLLKECADRLVGCMRDGDTASRFGGDEFVMFLEDMAEKQHASITAGRVLQALSKPFFIEGHDLYLGSSIGISSFPGDGEDAHALMKNADIAMYRAKEHGGSQYQFYSRDMADKAMSDLLLESRLRGALEHDEFILYYQPLIDATSQRIIGAEALIRWQSPDQGLVPPQQFIPLLEVTGLILPVGEWIVKTACTQSKAWHDAGHTGFRTSINLSVKQILDVNFVDRFSAAFADAGVDNGSIVLEITESTLMNRQHEITERIESLCATGVSFAIDDFGTGYSSLSYLKRFPIHILKIDRSFVCDMTMDNDDASIVDAIITMAHSLNMKVVAEGVETVEQAEVLRLKSCDILQGYLYGQPMTADELTLRIDEQSAAESGQADWSVAGNRRGR